MNTDGTRLPNGRAVSQESEMAWLLENSPDIIFRLDSDLRFTYVSPAVERHAGVPRDHFVGKCVLEIRAPGHDPEELAAKCRQALETGHETAREFDVAGKYYRTRIIPEFALGGPSKSLLGLTEDITERKLAEQRLRQSQQQYERLVESIDGIIWEIDCADCGKFAFVSKQAERVLGYPIAQWLHEKNFWSSHMHPDDRGWVIDLCKAAAANGEDHRFEYRMIAADGRIVWVRHIVTVETQNGQPKRLRGVMIDITQRKDEEALEAGRNRVLEMVASGAALSDVLRALVVLIESRCEGMLCSILLLDDDGVHVRETIAPSFPESTFAAIKGARIAPRAGSCGTAMYLKTPVVVTDILNDPLWEDFRELAKTVDQTACWSTPILSHAGKVLGTFGMYYRQPRVPSPEHERVLAVATHIARIAIEHQQAEKALRESEERSRATLKAIPDLMFLLSADGVYLDCHARSPEMLLLPPEQLLGKNMYDVVPAALADLYMHCFRELETSDEQTLEYDLMVHGKLRHSEARVVRSGDRYLALVRDITERKLAEEALRRSDDALGRSHQQIRELAGRLMGAQEEERRRISRELHDDLNQKIAAVSILLSKLKRQYTVPADSIRQELEQVQKHVVDLADRMRQLSHQLHPAVLEHAGLEAALRSFITEFSELEGIQIKLILPGERLIVPQPVALCLYRVAQESLRNIAKHSGAKRAHVKLSADRNLVKLLVEDQGRGFDPEGVKSGSGLGLVSIQERVRLLQGRVEVSAKPNSGTKISVSIPLQSDAEIEQEHDSISRLDVAAEVAARRKSQMA